MLKIRLQRIGRKNDPAFRVIVTESARGPKSGDHIELLGSYNPRQNTSSINADRVQYWISKGAQVSGTVHNLLVSQNIIEGAKVNVLPKKSPVVKETEESTPEAAAPAADAQAEAEADTASDDESAEPSTEGGDDEAPTSDVADESQEEKQEKKEEAAKQDESAESDANADESTERDAEKETKSA